MNLIKTIVINIFNLFIMVLLFYIAVSYCAVWNNWAPALLILWSLILAADFLVMEVALEFIIFLFYFGRRNPIWNFFFKLLLAIKNLRNTF